MDRLRSITVIILFLVGSLLALLSLAAELLGLDLTPGFGVIQMFQLLIGITLLTLAGYVHVRGLRQNVTTRSLQAEIGVRLAATGLVFAYVAGFSDLIQIGTHTVPEFQRPFVGPLQLGGIVVSVLLITVGILLYYTSRATRPASSLRFFLARKNSGRPDKPRDSADVG